MAPVPWIAAVPRIDISVYRTDAGPGQTQFSAEGGSVSWSIHPAVGRITAEGLYTAPASVQTPLFVTVKGQSTADATRSGVSWAGVGQKSGEIKYENAFNSPFLDGSYGYPPWNVIDEGTKSGPSNWKIVDSTLLQTSSIYGGAVDAFSPDKPGTYVLLARYNEDNIRFDPYQWRNYTVSVRLRSTDDDAIGIMFGYRDANNYYRFSMDRERKYRRLVKVVNGVFTVLAEDSVAYQTGRWYNVQVTMARATVQVLVDGTEIFNVLDTSHVQGSIGLYSWNNPGAEFDDLGVLQNTRLGCTYSFQPKSVDVGAQAASGAVNLVTQDDCGWTLHQQRAVDRTLEATGFGSALSTLRGGGKHQPHCPADNAHSG